MLGVSEEADIDVEVELVPPSRRNGDEERGGKKSDEKKQPKRRDLQPASGQLLAAKVDFLNRILGGLDGLADFIRREAEQIIYKAFLVYMESQLRKQGFKIRRHVAYQAVMDVINEFWEENKTNIVDMALDKFKQYLERQSEEKIADKYIRCWSGVSFYCRVDKDRLIEDFKRSGTISLHYILDDLTPDLFDLIYYVIAESEVQAQ